ncbi:SMP-30/gluconolactonase/LRE family protein [Legionella sp. CNM-1927-20]|uniref:SMP-30/gluconolactonase/LRE family protein n=1 Tax=Legionella sp. CNM-1927-20 TaxID=3422221 RepID=UPI00403B2074
MHIKHSEVLLTGFEFAEGLRWRNGQLWFCDLKGKKIYSLGENHKFACKVKLNDSPAAIGWLSDGQMLVTSLYKRKVLSINNKGIYEYADLSLVAPGYGHDMIVAANDTIYISASGFYPTYSVRPVKSNVVMIEPSGKLSIAAKQVGYPNGLALINNESQMIVAETFAANLALYDLNAQGLLTNKRSFYSFDDKGFQVAFDKYGVPKDLSRYYPDGIDYDVFRNILWVASPGKNEVLGIKNSTIRFKIKTQGIPFDCVIGGEHYDILYIGSSSQNLEGWSGQIEFVKIVS